MLAPRSPDLTRVIRLQLEYHRLRVFKEGVSL